VSDMTLGKMISSYIALRDKKKAIADEQAKVLKEYTEAMAAIEEVLKQHMLADGVQNIATDEGTAFLKVSRRATVADKSAFREYVISSKNFDMADFSAKVEAVQDFVNDPANAGSLPPGVNFATYQSVGVQRK
jgi:pyocin large subunit-like protein